MNRENGSSLLRDKLINLLNDWQETGIPPRHEMESVAVELLEWKSSNDIISIWDDPPLMVTATLDDGLGLGLRLIHQYAEVAGLHVKPLGLYLPPEEIIDRCRSMAPDILGMTVLQFTSEEALTHIAQNLPDKTRLVAGGPVFSIDPDFANRSGVYFVAKNAAEFLGFVLSIEK